MNKMHNKPKKSKNDPNSPPRLKNGTVQTVCIDRMHSDGYGIATIADVDVLIPNTAKGDTVVVRIDHVSKQSPVAWAQVLSVNERGPNWKKHFCKLSIQSQGKCGGCPLGHISKDVYRELKQESVNTELEKHNISQRVSSIFIGSALNYRNKSNFITGKQKTGNVNLGSFVPRSHRFAPMNGCKINTRTIGKVQQFIETILTQNDTPVFPSDNGVRFVTIKSFETGAVLVDLVIHGTESIAYETVSKQILEHESVHGVSITCNSEQGNRIRTQSHDAGIGILTLRENIGDIALWMTTATFFQLNNEVAQKMYQQVASWCSDAKTVWDLYCGIGGLGLTVAKVNNSKLFGCDSISSSIELAKTNAETNSIEATYETINLETAYPSAWSAPDVILINPPRKGIDPHTMDALCTNKVEKIIYMSCNPATFAKDSKALEEAGYSLQTIEAFDMLPFTSHVELLGLFTSQ